MPEQAKVIDYRKIPSPDPKRVGKQDSLYVVEASGGVRVVIRIPAESKDPDALKKAVQAELQERGQQIGRTLEL